MTAIHAEDVVYLGLVSLLAGYQLARFARRVGNAREKYKIQPPLITGDPAFDRMYRAQQNSLEFFPIFMICMWVCGIFLHQVPAALMGLYYLYARNEYFDGYSEDADKRLVGFYKSIRALRLFVILSLAGLVNTLLAMYTGLNIVQTVLNAKLGI